jgi:hypothetical protein
LPLASELDHFSQLSGRSRERVSTLLGDVSSKTFGDLLHEQSPAAFGIELIKDFAKASLVEDGGLPRQVARVLYLLAVARGRAAGYHDISSLDDARLDREARACLAFDWLPEGVRDLLHACIERRGSQRKEDRRGE